MAKKKKTNLLKVASSKPIDSTYTEIYHGGVTINPLAVLKEELTFTNGGTSDSYLPATYDFVIDRPDLNRTFRVSGEWGKTVQNGIPAKVMLAKVVDGRYYPLSADGTLEDTPLPSTGISELETFLNEHPDFEFVYEGYAFGDLPSSTSAYVLPSGWKLATGASATASAINSRLYYGSNGQLNTTNVVIYLIIRVEEEV